MTMESSLSISRIHGKRAHKEYTWYALTDKWILSQNVRTNNVQQTYLKKPKPKEDQSASVFMRKGTKYS